MWGLRDRPGAGPKPGPTSTRSSGPRVRLPPTGGIGAVSMGRVAEELGAHDALYRYVEAKDEPLVLMVDAALGRLPPRRRQARAGGPVCALGPDHLASATHPWIVRCRSPPRRSTPNQVAWLDSGLPTLPRRSAGGAREALHDHDRERHHARNWALLTADITAAAGPIMPTLGPADRRADRPGALPRASRRARVGRLRPGRRRRRRVHASGSSAYWTGSRPWSGGAARPGSVRPYG